MREYIAGIIEIPQIREEITDVAQYLWQKGWAERNAGNLSYNITQIFDGIPDNFDFDPPVRLKRAVPNLNNNILLVTGTGTRMRDVGKNPHANTCILHIIENGTAYRQLLKPELDKVVFPTSELPSHLAIHNMLSAENREERVIIHTHPNKLIALTHINSFCNEEHINNMLWSIQPETCLFIHDGIGFTPYLQTGSNELAEMTINKLKNHRVVLWEKHGCLAIGKDAYEAFDLIDIAEKSADIFFTCKNAGYDVEGISPKQLDELREAFGINQGGKMKS